MPRTVTLRFPTWFPCFLSTLIAFSMSLKPAMSLPTLPPESGLQGISPVVAVATFTCLGFIWGVFLSWVIAKQGVTTEMKTASQQ